MNDTDPGLRARKKRQTRQTIADAATRLFIERGFEKVTIADVAAAAGVAKMTVSNYFPRKEDLALDAHEEFVAYPARVIADRQPGESALAALRRAHTDALSRHDPLVGFTGRSFARMLTASPVLLARLRELHEQRETAIADILAAAPSTQPQDVTPRVAAALLGATLRVLFAETQCRTLQGDTVEEVAIGLTEVARAAFDLLDPALGAYAIQPT